MRISNQILIQTLIYTYMESKYIVQYKSWRTREYVDSKPVNFEEAGSLFHLHVNNGEITSIIEINGE